MSFELHETVYGKRFFEHQLPELITGINRLAAAMEKQNETSQQTLDFLQNTINKKSTWKKPIKKPAKKK